MAPIILMIIDDHLILDEIMFYDIMLQILYSLFEQYSGIHKNRSILSENSQSHVHTTIEILSKHYKIKVW